MGEKFRFNIDDSSVSGGRRHIEFLFCRKIILMNSNTKS